MNRPVNRNISRDEFLFVASYAIFMIMNTLRDSFFSAMFGITLYKLAIIASALILFIKESLQEKSSAKTICQILIGIVMAVLILKNSSGFGQYSVMYFILFAISARTIPFKKVVRYSLIISLISLSVVLISSQAGIIRDHVAYDGGRNRHFLGFQYALYPATILFNITGLMFLNGRNTKKDICLWILLLLFNYWIYIKTDSRTCFALSLILIFLHFFLLLRTNIENNRFLRWCMILSVIIFAFISIYITVNYDSSVGWQSALNSKLAKRLFYGQQSIRDYGVKAFGQNIKWVGNGLDEFGAQQQATTNWVDCMYIRVLQKYGYIFFGIWTALMTYALRIADKKNLSRLMIFCTIVAAHCMIDDLSMYLHYNTTWLLLGILLMRQDHDPEYSEALQPLE